MKPKRLRIKVARLANGKDLPLPAYQTPAAAGMDIYAAISEDLTVVLSPGMHAVVPAGFAMELPRGTEAQIRPRSGLAAKYGVTVLNSPGTIDADYRGEIGVILINHGQQDFAIRRGDRIAQMVIASVAEARLVDVRGLGVTQRGAGGFGSTGIKVEKRQIVKKRSKSSTFGTGVRKTRPSKAKRPAKR